VKWTASRVACILAVFGLLACAAEVAAEDPPVLRLGSLWFLSEQRLEQDQSTTTELVVKRGHLDLYLDLASWATVRVTPDVTVDAHGDAHAPVKYAYLRLSQSKLGWLRAAHIDLGRVPTPWYGFAESVNRYRMQDGTFMDRLGFFSSADEGVAVGGLLGQGLPDRFLEGVRPAFPGRWGSFVVGVYTGSGFKEPDRNHGLVFQGRLSLRPLPDAAPGLQLSALAIRGAGNTAASPDWTVDALLVSWQSRYLVTTLQGEENCGVQSGAWVDAGGRALPGRGWSAFTELRQGPGRGWASFVRYDRFDRDHRRPGGRLERTIVGVARHLAGGSAVLLDWEHVDPEAAPSSNRLQLTLQLRLSPRPMADF